MKAHKRWISLILIVSFVTACAVPQRGGPGAEHGFISMFKGIGHLVLSPFQIAAGLAEGVASLPYYAATSLTAINDGFAKAQAKITLDDTYDAAYGKRLSQVRPEGDTGEVFRRMKHASEYFQKVLRQYGVPDPEHYILTSIDTVTDQGSTLFAVVYRPAKSITVIDKYDGKTIRNFSSEDRLFYEPFEKDVNGKPIDVVIDWAGVPVEYSNTQKQQAVLLTLAANAVVQDRKRTDYWAAESRWIAGDFQEIMKQQIDRVKKSIGVGDTLGLKGTAVDTLPT